MQRHMLFAVAACQALLTEVYAQSAFQPTWESPSQYQVPVWFRDAKFGIFIPWGAYSVPAFGSEWYPREMYQQGSASFYHHKTDFVVELKETRQVRSVRIGCPEDQNSWIFFPRSVDAFVSSDGRAYGAAVHIDAVPVSPDSTVARREFSLPLPAEGSRFIRIRATDVGVCPAWHKGAGGKAWLFLDEVTVE